MKIRILSLMLCVALLYSCQPSSPSGAGLSIQLSLDDAIKASIQNEGRLFVFLNQNPEVEPRTRTWPSKGNYVFAQNLKDFSSSLPLEINAGSDWISTTDWSLDNIPEGDYYMQILWDQDTEESRINAPGNIYSDKQKVSIKGNQKVDFTLNQIIEDHDLVEHELVRFVDFSSDTLSAWWGKPVKVKAAILLPRNYDENAQKTYPVRYNVAGYGGRYFRINNVVKNQGFMEWWASEDAPEMINVFLDGEGPFGDSYQMDSENSGPYGYSLTEELIPHIEKTFRGKQSSKSRFVDGCSTGGWVSLGLQLYYPDVFNGVFSYSPDAIEFENYQLINLYEDENAYENEHGYQRPVMRDVNGEPMMSVKEFLQYENVLGASNTYLNSGGQFSAHNALYGPKGENDLPKPIFDPYTGTIDQSVAEHWKKYDFKLYAEENWADLGPKLQGKVYIWMGDMDNFYLNPATRAFDKFLKSTSNPKSDAKVEFSAMEGHCWQFSHRRILEQMQGRLKQIGG